MKPPRVELYIEIIELRTERITLLESALADAGFAIPGKAATEIRRRHIHLLELFWHEAYLVGDELRPVELKPYLEQCIAGPLEAAA